MSLWSKLLLIGVEPFKRGEILFNQAGDNGDINIQDKLPKGYYRLKLCSSAANGQSYIDGIWMHWAGTSGTVWEGIFRLKQNTPFVVSVKKAASQPAFIDFNGTRMITCPAPAKSGVNWIDGAKIPTVNENLQIIKTEVSGGVKGGYGNGYSGPTSTISKCTIRPWGDCPANPASYGSWIPHSGGFFLQYLGQKI